MNVIRRPAGRDWRRSGSGIDCVVANGILNLSPDKSAVLSEVARILKPDGRFIVAETTLRHELPSGGVNSLDDWFR